MSPTRVGDHFKKSCCDATRGDQLALAIPRRRRESAYRCHAVFSASYAHRRRLGGRVNAGADVDLWSRQMRTCGQNQISACRLASSSQPASRETDRARRRASRIARGAHRAGRCAARRGSRGSGPPPRDREALRRRNPARVRRWHRRRPDRGSSRGRRMRVACPMIGPSPSMPTMPSTMVRPGLTVATRSTMEP